MDHYEYREGSLFCEDVPVADVARQVGTPVYIYSAATLREHYRRLDEAFAPLEPNIRFAMKSLGNLHVLRLLSELGAGFDVVSGGEVFRAGRAGADMSRVCFAGVAKTDAELREAITAGVGLFNVESAEEFENLSRIAAEMGVRVRAGLRINPDVYDPRTHVKTTTGRKETKFGVDIDRAMDFFRRFGRDDHVRLDVIDMHIGSPIYSPQPYVGAIEKALWLIDELGEGGFEIRGLDIGGGFAADYEEGKSPAVTEYAEAIVPLLQGRELEIFIEPGRFISCNAGVLLCSVLYRKAGGSKKFLIVDAAMTDLLRPALYDAEHFCYPAEVHEDAPPPPRKMDFAPPNGQKMDVVGGVCESSDVLAAGRVLPPMRRGELLAIFAAGAYGFVMASQYNARPRAAEVLVEGDSWRIIRRRETYEDLIAAEEE
jgi:diaminopimelate decarboxylase